MYNNHDKLLSMADLCTLPNRQLQDMAFVMHINKKQHLSDARLFHMTDTKYSLRNKEFTMPRFQLHVASITSDTLTQSYGV